MRMETGTTSIQIVQKTKNIILVDDSIGSGKRAADFIARTNAPHVHLEEVVEVRIGHDLMHLREPRLLVYGPLRPLRQ